MKASELKNLKCVQIIDKVSKLFKDDQRDSGILASVSFAQFILESGWGKSELAQECNNLFGMKSYGPNFCVMRTKEWDGSKYVHENARFKEYPSIEESIKDHSNCLRNATRTEVVDIVVKKKNKKNVTKEKRIKKYIQVKRYDGIVGCKDYRKAFKILKNGGYASSPDYVEILCSIVEKWNLTRFDA